MDRSEIKRADQMYKGHSFHNYIILEGLIKKSGAG